MVVSKCDFRLLERPALRVESEGRAYSGSRGRLRTCWGAAAVVAAWMLAAPTETIARQSSDPRVRAMSPAATRLLAYGLCRSSTIRSLMAGLEKSDVIVLVEVSLDPSIGQARTSLLSANSAARFLHTQISARLSPERQLEILGHELLHASEIADLPEVKDQRSLREAYVRLGWQLATSHDHETQAAREAERLVKREVATPASRDCLKPGLPRP